MKVKFYDSKTKTVTEMPEEELAPGCFKTKIAGMDGEYFMRWDGVKKGGPFRHPPMTKDLKMLMTEFEETFREVMPMSAAKWEEGFRRDDNAEREIAIWLFIASHFKNLTQDPNFSLNAKLDYFIIINQFVTSGAKYVRSLVQLRELSKNEMKRVIAILEKPMD